MARFSNSPTKSNRTIVGGDQKITPEELALTVKKFERIEESFDDLKDEIRDFKSNTNNWILGGFVALVFIVVGLLIAVGAMANDYLLMKQNSYQSLIDKINEQNTKNSSLEKTVNLICKTWRKDCPPI